MINMFPNPINKGLSLTKVIGGMSKTLNVINQLLPLYKEAKPMIQNAQNAFRVAKELVKKENKEENYKAPQLKNDLNSKKTEPSVSSTNRPVFFV